MPKFDGSQSPLKGGSAMPGGNSFDDVLWWDKTLGGYIAKGPTDWRNCTFIRVMVYQSKQNAAAAAEGKR